MRNISHTTEKCDSASIPAGHPFSQELCYLPPPSFLGDMLDIPRFCFLFLSWTGDTMISLLGEV